MIFQQIDSLFSTHWLKKLKLNDSQSSIFLCALIYSARKGHFCLALDQLLIELAPMKKDLLIGAQKVLSQAQKLNLPLVRKRHGAYYLQRQFLLEKEILRALFKIQCYSKDPHFKMDEQQKIKGQTQELLNFCQHRSPIFITGGPGSGKTYFAKNLINLYLNSCKNKLVTIAAFTAKAAHLFASIQRPQVEIKTLHALIKPRSVHRPKIHTDLLIIDEASMISPQLFCKLLQSLLPQTLIIFMGDPHQLAPVESLSVFEHLAPLLKGHHHHLQGSWRSNSSIQTLAQNALLHDRQRFFQTIKNDTNLELIDSTQTQLIEYLKKRLEETYPKGTCQGPLNKLLILTPFAHSSKGYIKLNTQLKRALDFSFIPITIEKNEVAMGLSNGQMGVVIQDYAYFYFEKHSKKIHTSLLPKYSPSYATSIHKSQGSSAQHCIIILDRTHDFLSINLLYTAITRAKQKCTFISTNKILTSLLQPMISLMHKLDSHSNDNELINS